MAEKLSVLFDLDLLLIIVFRRFKWNVLNIYWKAKILLPFYRLALANLCCFSFYRISCLSRRTIIMAYTTSTVRDIYRLAVFCSVTRLFFVSVVSLVFMKGTSCCVLRSWAVRPSYGKSFEVGRTMVYTTRKTVNRLASIHLNPLAPERSKEE